MTEWQEPTTDDVEAGWSAVAYPDGVAEKLLVSPTRLCVVMGSLELTVDAYDLNEAKREAVILRELLRQWSSEAFDRTVLRGEGVPSQPWSAWTNAKPIKVGWYGKRHKATKAQTLVWVDHTGFVPGRGLSLQTIDGVARELSSYDPSNEYEWQGPVELLP